MVVEHEFYTLADIDLLTGKATVRPQRHPRSSTIRRENLEPGHCNALRDFLDKVQVAAAIA